MRLDKAQVNQTSNQKGMDQVVQKQDKHPGSCWDIMDECMERVSLKDSYARKLVDSKEDKSERKKREEELERKEWVRRENELKKKRGLGQLSEGKSK